MCTSIVSNEGNTIVGWNLDILKMEHRVVAEHDKVYIAINDPKEGWMPLFGANVRGDFVAMPTCWPYDRRSDPTDGSEHNIIMLNIDLLLGKRTLSEIREIGESMPIRSIPGVTFQSQLSDRNGNVLQIVPGQGIRYLPRPRYAIMTNFSPFKGDSEQHPWMGWDRYRTAAEMLNKSREHFTVPDCFEILKETAQTTCPTVVSMVFDVADRTVYWCENREWNRIATWKMSKN